MKENRERVNLFLAANLDECLVANLGSCSVFCLVDYLVGYSDNYLVAR